MKRFDLVTWLRLIGLVGSILALSVRLALAQAVTRLPPVAVQLSQHAEKYPIRLVSHEEPLPVSDVPLEPAPAPRPETDPSASLDSNRQHQIDLPTALRLADRVNPQIGISRQAILEALARLKGARVLLLPSLAGGGNYHDHNGNLQRAGGTILDLPAEQSFYVGAGARTLAAESVAFPGLRIFSHLGDAIFEPLAARQRTVGRQFDASATFNSVLLEVSTRYIDLMAAEARLAVLRRSLRDATEAARLTANFARVGQGRQADADRMQTEALLLESQVERAGEDTAVASAELARLLNLDPAIRLRTVGGPIPLLELVDPSCKLGQLLEIALERRPEMAARMAQIAEARTRYRQEQTRALLPTISVGFSAGDFGGGSNLVDPVFGRFAGRTDFDALAYWTMQNLGVGNVALWRQRRAQEGEAIAARSRTVNLVRREVAESLALATAARRQVDVSEQRLDEAEAGLREELHRIEAGQGLPIELLDNLTRAVEARQAIIAAFAAYDRAEFRLFVALGQPPTCALPSAEALNASARDEAGTSNAVR
jgi:outer membrane protein TolC